MEPRKIRQMNSLAKQKQRQTEAQRMDVWIPSGEVGDEFGKLGLTYKHYCV